MKFMSLRKPGHLRNMRLFHHLSSICLLLTTSGLFITGAHAARLNERAGRAVEVYRAVQARAYLSGTRTASDVLLSACCGRAQSAEPDQCERSEEIFAEAQQLNEQWTVSSLQEAIKRYTTAQACWQAAGQTRSAAIALQKIGDIRQQTREYQKAQNSYQESLALWRSLQDRQAEARTLSDLGLASFYVGETDKAQQYFAQALSVSREMNDKAGEAHALNCAGERAFLLGLLPEAFEKLRQAQLLLGDSPDHRELAQLLLNLGHALTESGELDEAMTQYQKALALWEELKHPWGQNRTLVAMSRIYTMQSENQKALDSNERALALSRTIGDRIGEGATLNNIGYAYESLGENELALNHYLQALHIFEQPSIPMGRIVTLRYVGGIYNSLGNSVEAQKAYEQAFSLIKSLPDRPLLMEADALNDIGMSYFSAGKSAQALSSYQHALAIFEQAKDERGLAYTNNNLGYYYERAGEKQRALRYYEQALGLLRTVRDREGTMLLLYNVASLERDLGQLDAARSHIEESIKAIEASRTKLLSQDLRASYIASLYQHYELYIDVLMRLDHRQPDSGFALAAWQASERGRARSLVELLLETATDVRQGIDADLWQRKRALEQKLNILTTRQAELLSSKADEAQITDMVRNVQLLTTQYEELKTEIKLKNPHYAALTQPQPLDLKSLQQVLDDQTILLEYTLGERNSYLWVVTSKNISSHVLPGRAEISGAALRVYKLLTTEQQGSGTATASTQKPMPESERDAQYWHEADILSRLILGPVANQLGTKRLLVVADGELQYIPFGALPTPATEPRTPSETGALASDHSSPPVPLVENHEIINLPSASTLAILRSEEGQRKLAPKTLAVLADPVFEFDDPRLLAAHRANSSGTATNSRSHSQTLNRALKDIGASLPRLMSSRQEAKAIMAFAPTREAMESLDFAASRATATNAALGQYRIIHFATHSVLDEKHPDLSGIVLSLYDKTGQPLNDGYMRMRDIYNLSLPVELVVLSACRTGLGKQVRGEGLVGLTRGFMYAGARRVVASLWKVDDAATAELMTRFYQQMLKEGKTAAAALREAQLSMRQQSRWHSPYYWAGFVLQGEWK